MFVYWKTQNCSGKYNFLPLEKCAEHLEYLMKLDKFVTFGRPQSGTMIIQLMTSLMFLIDKYRNSNTKPVYKAKQCDYFTSQRIYFENI